MMLRYNEDEYAAVCQAAQKVGLTPTGYAALVALAAATDKPPPRADPLRDALAELIVARLQVRRFGVNVNQAVVALHATGQAPPGLASATALASRAVARVDEAAAAITRSLP
jgi:hypothetical protein